MPVFMPPWYGLFGVFQFPHVTNVEVSRQTFAPEHDYEQATAPLIEFSGYNPRAVLIEGIAADDSYKAQITGYLGTTASLSIVAMPTESYATRFIVNAINYTLTSIEWTIEGGFSQAYFKYKVTLVKA